MVLNEVYVYVWKMLKMWMINPLSANVEYTPHGGDVTCRGCGVSYKQNH